MSKLWLAMNRNGELLRFEEKPVYVDDGWLLSDTWVVPGCTMADSDYGIEMDKAKFPEVTFETSPIVID